MASTTTKISLFEMAEAVGELAFSVRGHVERWDRDHPNDPLPPTHQWVIDAARLGNAHLTLAIMALDEDASRKAVSAIIKAKGDEAKLLIGMLTLSAPARPKAEAEAA